MVCFGDNRSSAAKWPATRLPTAVTLGENLDMIGITVAAAAKELVKTLQQSRGQPSIDCAIQVPVYTAMASFLLAKGQLPMKGVKLLMAAEAGCVHLRYMA